MSRFPNFKEISDAMDENNLSSRSDSVGPLSSVPSASLLNRQRATRSPESQTGGRGNTATPTRDPSSSVHTPTSIRNIGANPGQALMQGGRGPLPGRGTQDLALHMLSLSAQQGNALVPVEVLAEPERLQLFLDALTPTRRAQALREIGHVWHDGMQKFGSIAQVAIESVDEGKLVHPELFKDIEGENPHLFAPMRSAADTMKKRQQNELSSRRSLIKQRIVSAEFLEDILPLLESASRFSCDAIKDARRKTGMTGIDIVKEGVKHAIRRMAKGVIYAEIGVTAQDYRKVAKREDSTVTGQDFLRARMNVVSHGRDLFEIRDFRLFSVDRWPSEREQRIIANEINNPPQPTDPLPETSIIERAITIRSLRTRAQREHGDPEDGDAKMDDPIAKAPRIAKRKGLSVLNRRNIDMDNTLSTVVGVTLKKGKAKSGRKASDVKIEGNDELQKRLLELTLAKAEALENHVVIRINKKLTDLYLTHEVTDLLDAYTTIMKEICKLPNYLTPMTYVQSAIDAYSSIVNAERSQDPSVVRLDRATMDFFADHGDKNMQVGVVNAAPVGVRFADLRSLLAGDERYDAWLTDTMVIAGLTLSHSPEIEQIVEPAVLTNWLQHGQQPANLPGLRPGLRRVILPLAEDGHWTLIFLDLANGTAHYRDSLAIPERAQRGQQIIRTLQHQWRLNLQIMEDPGIQQANTFDCGMFVIFNAEVLRGNTPAERRDPLAYRSLIGTEVLGRVEDFVLEKKRLRQNDPMKTPSPPRKGTKRPRYGTQKTPRTGGKKDPPGGGTGTGGKPPQPPSGRELRPRK